MNHLIKLNKCLLINYNLHLKLSPYILLNKRWSSNSNTIETLSNAKYSSDSPIINFIEETIFNLHETSGLEWSTTIVLTAFSLRLFTLFPLKIYTEYKSAKMLNCQYEIAYRLQDKLKKFASINLSEIQKYKQLEFNRIQNEIFKKENCRPSQLFAATLLEFIIWLSVSMSIRNLTINNSLAQIAMTTEGALWFNNLTISDQFYVLPLIYALVSLLNIYVRLVLFLSLN
jgi:hypothetical protein